VERLEAMDSERRSKQQLTIIEREPTVGEGATKRERRRNAAIVSCKDHQGEQPGRDTCCTCLSTRLEAVVADAASFQPEDARDIEGSSLTQREGVALIESEIVRERVIVRDVVTVSKGVKA
jgi:hypothetical protein